MKSLHDSIQEALAAVEDKIAATKRVDRAIEEALPLINERAQEFAAAKGIKPGVFLRWVESGVARTGKVIAVKSRNGVSEWSLTKGRNTGDAKANSLSAVMKELVHSDLSAVMAEVALFNATGQPKMKRPSWRNKTSEQDTEQLRLDRNGLRVLTGDEVQKFLAGKPKSKTSELAGKLAGLSDEKIDQLLEQLKKTGAV